VQEGQIEEKLVWQHLHNFDLEVDIDVDVLTVEFEVV
jgi:hypothetical protein